MKRILLLADANSNHTRKWALLLKEQGSKIHIFSFYPILDNWHNENDIELFTFYKTNQVSLFRKLLYPFAYFSLKRILTKINPNIINAQYASSYGLIGALVCPNKFLLSFWGSDVFVFPKKSWFHKKLLQWVISKSNKIFSSSKIMASEIDLYTKKEVVLIPFGIDTSEYTPKTYSEIDLTQPIILGMVKSLEHIYRIDVAIDAVKILNETSNYHFNLLICGAGSLETELKARSNDDILIKGRINQDEVSTFIHSLDLFLNTTDFESFGVSTIEAMACGTPVIAHNSGGSAEIITHQINGYLYTPNEARKLAEMIIEAIENPTKMRLISEHARKHVVENYDLRIVQKKISDYFFS